MRPTGATLLAATSLLTGSIVAAIDPIVIKGTKFFNGNTGAQFFLKGVAYGSDYTGQGAVAGADKKGGYNDALANPAACKRDIPYLKELDTNVIRVYDVDTSLDHYECMTAFADAGIYILADLSNPTSTGSIDRTDPEWTDDLYASYAAVVDTLANYTNVLGFFAGNEVANAPNVTGSAPFVKAAVRDMKAYIKQQGYRSIGVGYATNDNPAIREILADYFNCGDQTDAIDFWGYNIYSWCGVSGYVTSGYAARTEEFSSYSVPVFFAEFGCNTVEPRLFDEVTALYGTNMTPVFSGGVVYEYFQATNDYGLVTVGSNSKVTTLTDFDNYKTKISAVSPSSTSEADYTPSNQPQACPTSQVDFRAQPTPLPPTPNEELCSCMYSALDCVVKASTNVLDYADDFSYVCAKDPDACLGFTHKSTTGEYGAYSMCNSTQQLGWAFNYYYYTHKKVSTACNFGGHAEVQSPASLSSTCKALIKEAGGQGTNTVTSSPSGTGAGAAASGGSGSSASASSSKGGAAGSFAVLHMKSDNKVLQISCILALALMSGFAAVLL